jgi:outer membrane beta-barrel protein
MACAPHIAWAQADLENDSASKSDQEVEELYDKDEVKTDQKAKAEEERAHEKKPVKDVQSLSDLATLAPFSDVAVIQRRFLPKTGRFELTGGVFTNVNNPFFNSIGANARLAYYFTERYAVEGIASFATTSTRQVTDDLEANRRITTDNVVTSNGYYVLAFKWNPIYGKMTWLNKTIVPFDINFNAGVGMTHTTEDEMEPTIHFGTSQVFALSKSMAFRWDLTWNMYQATATTDAGTKETLSQNDLFLGVGMSFYFPEATYR